MTTQTLRRRLEKLEGVMFSVPLLVRVRQFTSPTHAGFVAPGIGGCWMREPGETDQALWGRAMTAALDAAQSVSPRPALVALVEQCQPKT